MAALDRQLSRPITVGMCNTCNYVHISPIDGADSDIHIQPKTPPSFTLISSSSNKPTLSEENFLRAVKVSEAYQKVLGSVDKPSQMQVTCTVRYDLGKMQIATVEITQGCHHECVPPQARPDHPGFAQYLLQQMMQAEVAHASKQTNLAPRQEQSVGSLPSASQSVLARNQAPDASLRVTVSQMASPSYTLNPDGSVIVTSGPSIQIVQRGKGDSL